MKATTHEEFNNKGQKILELLDGMLEFAAETDQKAFRQLLKASRELRGAGSRISAAIYLDQ